MFSFIKAEQLLLNKKSFHEFEYELSYETYDTYSTHYIKKLSLWLHQLAWHTHIISSSDYTISEKIKNYK